jgi:hypothetical protein
MLASTLQFDEDNELQLCLSGVALALGAQQVFSYCAAKAFLYCPTMN